MDVLYDCSQKENLAYFLRHISKEYLYTDTERLGKYKVAMLL